MFYTRFIVTIMLGTIISTLASFGADYLGATKPVSNLVLVLCSFSISGLMFWTEYDMQYGERI